MLNNSDDTISPKTVLTTSVLFLIFNRLDTTKKVFNEIKKARPQHLYIASDGPRPTHPEEKEIVRTVREYVLSSIDWDCEVHTLFRDENLGCKRAVSSAIDWFFSQVDEGIILEDDCLPDQSFFPFCQELLEKYREDNRIMMITGTYYLISNNELKDSYYFSKYYAIWGWATWKRAWSLYDVNIPNWPLICKERVFSSFFNHKGIEKYFEDTANKTYYQNLDTWDIQWVIACISHNGLVICPKNNLISNIGVEGTHYRKATRYNLLPLKKIDTKNMEHPDNVIYNSYFDKKYFDEIVKKPWWQKITHKIRVYLQYV